MEIGYEFNPLDLSPDQCQVLVRNMDATISGSVLTVLHAIHFKFLISEKIN